MNKPITKPASILRSEFITSLTELINTSGLPAFIIEPILKDFYFDIKSIAQNQLSDDVKTYEEALENAKCNNLPTE